MADTSLEPAVMDTEEAGKSSRSSSGGEGSGSASSASTIAGLTIEQVGSRDSDFNMLIYGIPGSGKTLLAASACEVEEMSPILHVDIEGGTETLKRVYPNVDSVRVKNITDKSGRIKKTAWEQLIDLHDALQAGKGGYRTVVIDNLTEGYQLSLADVMSNTVTENPERDPDVPAQREWGKASTQVRRWVRWMRDLPMNVIFTTHEQAHTTDSGVIVSYTPSLPGKLAHEISAYMDFVLYLYVKTDKGEDNKKILTRKLQTQPAGKYMAKDRTDKLPLILSEPTMTKIFTEVNK